MSDSRWELPKEDGSDQKTSTAMIVLEFIWSVIVGIFELFWSFIKFVWEIFCFIIQGIFNILGAIGESIGDIDFDDFGGDD